MDRNSKQVVTEPINSKHRRRYHISSQFLWQLMDTSLCAAFIEQRFFRLVLTKCLLLLHSKIEDLNAHEKLYLLIEFFVLLRHRMYEYLN